MPEVTEVPGVPGVPGDGDAPPPPPQRPPGLSSCTRYSPPWLKGTSRACVSQNITVLSPFVLSPSFVPHFYAPHPVLFTAIHCVVIVVKTWRK